MGHSHTAIPLAMTVVGVWTHAAAWADGGDTTAQEAEVRSRLKNQYYSRVTVDDERFVFIVPRADSTGLHYRQCQCKGVAAPSQPIPWSSIQSIELKHTGARNGAITGFVVGAGLGAAAMAISTSVGVAPSGEVAGSAVAFTVAAVLGLTGIGAGIGSMSYDWRPIDLMAEIEAARSIRQLPVETFWDDLDEELEDEDRARVLSHADTLVLRDPRCDGEGLRYASVEATMSATPSLVPWSEIRAVEVERSYLLHGIVAGLLVGAALWAGSTETDPLYLYAVPAMAVAVTIGARWHHWERVYEAPAAAGSTSTP